MCSRYKLFAELDNLAKELDFFSPHLGAVGLSAVEEQRDACVYLGRIRATTSP